MRMIDDLVIHKLKHDAELDAYHQSRPLMWPDMMAVYDVITIQVWVHVDEQLRQHVHMPTH
jgi:hypothetical protein